MDIKLIGFAPRHWLIAMQMARTLDDEYPDRTGVRNGVGFRHGDVSGYAYRTKTLIVVRSSATPS